MAQKPLEALRLNMSRTLPHELRTPLTSLIGFAQYLKTSGQSLAGQPDEITEIGETMYESSMRLYALIENYLFYAELALIEQNPTKQASWKNAIGPVQTRTIIPIFAHKTLAKYQRRDDLHLDLAEATVDIITSHLGKLLEELLENACKFSDPGTPVQIATRVEGRHWILSVTDDGRGMAAEQIAQLGAFMQFGREHYEQQGSGLGFAIAQKLVEWYHGELSVESIPNRGTTVTVTLNCR